MSAPAVADEPVGPFAVPVQLVYDLLPAAQRITDANNGGRVPTPITEESVRRWILQLSEQVTLALMGYEALSQVRREAIVGAARTAIVNGAASYAEAARFPARAGVNDSTYAGVLWQRYTTQLGTLTEQVGTWLDPEQGGPGDGGGGAQAGGPFGSFPTTRIGDWMQW